MDLSIRCIQDTIRKIKFSEYLIIGAVDPRSSTSTNLLRGASCNGYIKNDDGTVDVYLVTLSVDGDGQPFVEAIPEDEDSESKFLELGVHNSSERVKIGNTWNRFCVWNLYYPTYVTFTPKNGWIIRNRSGTYANSEQELISTAKNDLTKYIYGYDLESNTFAYTPTF